ncbi:protein-glutamate O-methyltransferase CheR [Vibrio sp. SCSIO 43135]|uniref:Chemotaxis protein methyltransferase n=1 Tax=Vibrio paucivorans TaxID=2829489 RepID=A0A9X3CH38_9VIBR|nr:MULTISPECIES: protein-glutamate O-methyltransferase CheR [Vibrio]MCW8335719.1 protein-glutamate O-methyltransferase CheR [Vibrio paucivorans]USD43374.1 protein-glutamate O-methyltransferase CheR [Vibrio sp. SCSIO 43135]
MGRVLTRSESDFTLQDNEFELTEKDFKFIQWFLHKTVGIYLSDRKRAMVYGRLSRQMRQRGLQRFADYRMLIETDEQERILFINSLTTNKTEFFREYHHFEFLEKVMLNEWQTNKRDSINIWSAGCSTGQEPYSLISSLYVSGAMEMFDEVSIRATDLDTKVLAHAKAGIYSADSVESIPSKYLKPCFVKGKQQQEGKIKIAKGLQKYVHFSRLNLLDSWPTKPKFDLISCRNVMIYFDKPTQEALLKRFHQALKPNGILFIGHSESVGACSELFHHLGQTIYVKQ